MSLNIQRPFSSALRQVRYHRNSVLSPLERLPFSQASRPCLTIHRACPAGFAARTLNSFCKAGTAPRSEHEHFFRYTSERWLWDEQQQLRDRYRVFNVVELQNLAVRATGSNSCVSITKLSEGGFNKVFRLLMDDEKTVLARIPNPNAGPAFYTTASEVATMELVSGHTDAFDVL